MKKFKRILKKMMLYLLAIILLLVLVVVLFVNLSPQMGASISKEKKELFKTSKQYKDGQFNNLGGVKMEMSFKDFTKSMAAYFSPQPHSVPEKDIAVATIDSVAVSDYNGPTRLVWFGHSAFLLQMNGKNILLDPMFGEVPAPAPFLGKKRFSAQLPIIVEKLPIIDAVIFSHDHYDHLDYGSVLALKDKVKQFITPLGVGSHLEKWGVPANHIQELDWWQETNVEDITFACTPAQHFSGRGLTDRGSTLWSSWVIKANDENLFFSGDSGYGDHFKDIGNAYGPFDFAMLECGQYNELWHTIHMMPEETAQAGIDVKAKKAMPIHWGAFKLAMHPWTEPVERVSVKAKELQLPLVTPKIGVPIVLGSEEQSSSKWWPAFN